MVGIDIHASISVHLREISLLVHVTRNKDWTKDAEEEKDRWKKKKAADAVKKCNARKRQMQSGTMVALNQEERTQGKLHVAFGVLLLTSILN